MSLSFLYLASSHGWNHNSLMITKVAATLKPPFINPKHVMILEPS